MDAPTLPNELLVQIFKSLDFTSLVKSRRVCRQWNDVSSGILDKLRIIYCFDNRDDSINKVSDLDEIAPWLDEEERVTFSRVSINTAITSDIKNLIAFTVNNCLSIEAFVHHGIYLPFIFFAENIGSRMRFFHGHFTFKWTEKSSEILNCFEKLEHFPGNRGPCNLVLLQYGLPLKCITTKCYTHRDCVNRLMATSIEEKESNQFNGSSLTNGTISPFYADSIKVLSLQYSRESDSTFCFPNLEQFSILHRMDNYRQVFTSLEQSPKLKSLKFELFEWRCLQIVESLGNLLDKLPLLECLEYNMPLRFGSFYHRYDDEDNLYEAIRKLLFRCRKLRHLALPFNLYSEFELAVDLFSDFTNLGYFRCREVSETFLHDMLTHLLHNPPASKQVTILGSLNDNRSIANRQLHDLIDFLGESDTLNKLNINYYCSDREHTCHVRRIVVSLTHPLEDQDFINFA